MEIEEIDLTPQGLQTPEGVERVNAHVKLFEEATAALANAAADFLNEHRIILLEVARGTAITETERASLRTSLVALQAVLDVRRNVQEGLLRAVAGRPPIPDGTTHEVAVDTTVVE
jgi:hypothetical protein